MTSAIILSNTDLYFSVEQGNKIMQSTYTKQSAIGLHRYFGQRNSWLQSVKWTSKFEDKKLSAKLYLKYR